MTNSLRVSSDDSCCFRQLEDESKRLVYEITRRCNLHCIHCMAPYETREGLTHERKIALMYELPQNNISKIMFTGGEPLLDCNLIEYVRIAAQYGILVDLNSNLTLLTKETVKQLKDAGLCEVTTSIDGNQETHTTIRGDSECYSKTLNSISLLRNAGIKVDVVCMVMDQTLEALEDALDIAQKYDVSSITYSGVIQKGRAKSRSNILNLEEMKEKMESLREKATIPVRSVRLYNNDFTNCHKGKDMIGIDYLGNLHPCLQCYSKKLINLEKLSLHDGIHQIQESLDCETC